jgi:ribonuclease HI
MMTELNIYTDGSCLNNPGKGGWGIVIVPTNGELEEYSKGYAMTTNSRMEMMAILMALRYAEKHNSSGITTIHSDSNFIVQAFNSRWIDGWVKKGWKKTKNEPVANVDLWKKIYPLSKSLKVNFVKVKAHSGIDYNEQVDELARAAAMSADLVEDKGYVAETEGEIKNSLNFSSETSNIIQLENVLHNGVPSIRIKSGTNSITIARKQIEEFLK